MVFPPWVVLVTWVSFRISGILAEVPTSFVSGAPSHNTNFVGSVFEYELLRRRSRDLTVPGYYYQAATRSKRHICNHEVSRFAGRSSELCGFPSSQRKGCPWLSSFNLPVMTGRFCIWFILDCLARWLNNNSCHLVSRERVSCPLPNVCRSPLAGLLDSSPTELENPLWLQPQGGCHD